MKLTTRSDLSTLYKLLRIVIRPIRPRLVNPGKRCPAGSPNLTPPKTKSYSIRHRQVEGVNLYDFQCTTTPKSDSNNITFESEPTLQVAKQTSHSHTHRIFYFAGGGFQSPPSKDHWSFCAELCRQLSNTYCITLVSYPLAPNSPAPESLPVLYEWFKTTCMESARGNESITLMGDSSGGNIVLALAFWWADQHVQVSEANTTLEPLKNVFVISPPTDLRNQNPSMTEADRHDPVLTIPLTANVAKAWAGLLGSEHQLQSQWTLDRPELSPNLVENAKFAKLRDGGVRIHGVVGTFDVLAPDAMVFYERCRENEVEGEWLKWEGQMHCFPLAWKYGLFEGNEGLRWIVNVLERSVI